MLIPNPRVVFAKRPGTGNLPVPGEHLVFDASPSIDLETVPLNGGFLTKTLMLRYIRNINRKKRLGFNRPQSGAVPPRAHA
jgi:hypothetical protein